MPTIRYRRQTFAWTGEELGAYVSADSGFVFDAWKETSRWVAEIKSLDYASAGTRPPEFTDIEAGPVSRRLARHFVSLMERGELIRQA